MTAETSAPPRKVPKLTPPQADALLAAAYGSLRVYRGWRDRPTIAADGVRGGRCPALAQPEATARAIARLGLVEIPELPDGPAGQHGAKLPLTDAGRAALSALFPAERLAAVEEWKERDRRDRRNLEAAALHRDLMSPPGHHERRVDLLDRLTLLRQEISAKRAEHSAVAYRLGDGANDVDGLLGELRRITVEVRALEAEDARLRREDEDDHARRKAVADAAVRARFPEVEIDRLR